MSENFPVFGDDVSDLMWTPGFAPGGPPVKPTRKPSKPARPMKVAPPGLFGNQTPPPQQQPGAHQMSYQMPAPTQMDYMHPAAREHFNNQAASIQQTNDAIAKEMDSRVDQARDSDQMAHEQYLANMKYQSEMAGHQASMAMNQQNLQAKQAKNAALMRAAGLGGSKTVNGKPVDAFDPLRSSLLG
jgi:hypothetical protein